MAREYDARANDDTLRRALGQLRGEVATLRQQVGAAATVADELATVRSHLRQAENELAEVTRTTLPALDGKADRAAATADQAAATADGLAERLGSALGVVRQLSAKVAHLEHQLRGADGVEEYALDDVPAEVVALTQTADAGRRAAAGSLAPADRERFEAEVSQAAAGEADWRTAVTEVLATSEALAAAPTDRAAASWPATVLRYRQAGEGLAALRRTGRGAQAALDDDAERRQANAATVAAGEAALTRARAALLARIGDAVTDRRLLPRWFTGRLGLPHGAGPGWLDLATDVLLYRVTYQVSDPLEALGELPHDAAAYRRDWHYRLGRSLADLVPPG